MISVYLVNLFNQENEYLETCSVSFTSRAAAQRYIEDCLVGVKAQIEQVELISLSDF